MSDASYKKDFWDVGGILLSIAVVSLLLIGLIRSCSGSSDGTSPSDTSTDKFLGTWAISTATINGQKIEFNTSNDYFFAYSISIGKDGYARFYVDGEEAYDKYSISGNSLKVTDASDGSKMVFVLKDERLVLDTADTTGPLYKDLSSSGISRMEFRRTKGDETSDIDNYIGSWTGYDAITGNVRDPNSFLESEPILLSEVSASSSLIINRDLTGTLAKTEQGSKSTNSIKLKASDKTNSYLVYDKGESDPIGTLSYMQSGNGTGWLVLTIYISKDTGEALQITYSKA